MKTTTNNHGSLEYSEHATTKETISTKRLIHYDRVARLVQLEDQLERLDTGPEAMDVVDEIFREELYTLAGFGHIHEYLDNIGRLDLCDCDRCDALDEMAREQAAKQHKLDRLRELEARIEDPESRESRQPLLRQIREERLFWEAGYDDWGDYCQHSGMVPSEDADEENDEDFQDGPFGRGPGSGDPDRPKARSG